MLSDCHTQTDPSKTTDCEITSLAIDPKNSNVLWIGQRGGDSTAQAVMRSTDGGQTWQSMKNTYNVFTAISLSPVNSNIVWALSQEGLGGQFVYRTADGGATWNAVKVDNTLNPADHTILADPFNASAAWESGGGEGLKRSVDGNGSWQPLSYEFYALGSIAQVLYGAAQWSIGGQSFV